MKSKTLHLGILFAKPQIAKWQYESLLQLISTKGVEATLIFCRPQTDENSHPSKEFFRDRIFGLFKRNHKLWNLYYNFAIRPRVSHFQPVDLSQVPFRFAEAYSAFEMSNHRISFPENEIQKLRNLNFSVLIDFDFGQLTGEILNLAPHGVWSFHHGGENIHQGIPPGFWEVYNDEPANGLILQRLTEDPDVRYNLQMGLVPTERRSLKNSLEILFSAGHAWPAKLCLMLLNGKEIPQTLSESKAKIRKWPSNFTVLLFLGKLFLRNLNYLFGRYFMAERWSIGVLKSSVHELISKPITSMTPIWFPHLSANSFEADPFGYVSSGQYKIFFEKFDYTSSLGSLSTITFDPQSESFQNEKAQLEGDYHLSYPFVFEYQDEIYSLVENYTEPKRNYLKLNRTTGKWDNFINVASARMMNDQTLIEHNGLWYVFFTEGRYGANFNFKIAYSETPFGPFTDHLLNPIKTDIQSSRSAGPLFKSKGKLYRPCQNSIDGYGSSVRIYEVTCLTPTEYEEEFICEINAPKTWGPFTGLHTISNLGADYTLIDCKSYEFVFSNFLHVLKRRFIR